MDLGCIDHFKCTTIELDKIISIKITCDDHRSFTVLLEHNQISKEVWITMQDNSVHGKFHDAVDVLCDVICNNLAPIFDHVM